MQRLGPTFEDISTEARTSAPDLTPAQFTLAVVEGPARGLQVKLAHGEIARVVVGKSVDADVCVKDPLVSRRHAAFEWDGARLEIVDLESTNGTTVNGISMAAATLRGGETVRFGGTAVRVVPVYGASRAASESAMSFGRLLGASPAMRRVYALAEKLAATDVPVILEGETGTGKELLAESLHEAGPRASAPFVVFDCAAAAAVGVERMLFGDEPTFTSDGAEPRIGVFEQAHGGTLLLDEVGELDLAVQAMILRAIERSEIRRGGSSTWRAIDVRILATTKVDLDRRVKEGRFRADLFFRLAVARIELPALRDRIGDVAQLTEHFSQSLGGGRADDDIPKEVMARFEEYAWPGNVRELLNAVARLRALSEVTDLGSASTPQLPAAFSRTARVGGELDDFLEHVLALHLPLSRARERVVDEFEKRYVQRVLADNAGNVTQAARASGIAKRYFQLLRARKQGPSP